MDPATSAIYTVRERDPVAADEDHWICGGRGQDIH